MWLDIPLNDMRFLLPQVRGMQFGPRLPIATQNDDPQGGKLHAPHLRKKKPQVIQRNVLQTACAKSRRSRGSLSGSIFLLHTECPSGIYAHRHRSRGWLSTCGHVREGLKSRIHAQILSNLPVTLGNIFFLPQYQFVCCRPSFWSELALHLYEQSK